MKRKRISLPIAEPLEKLDLSQVKELADKYGKTTSVNKLLESHNYAKIVTMYETIIQQDFYIKSLKNKIEAAVLLGCLQATLTDFNNVDIKWKENI